MSYWMLSKMVLIYDFNFIPIPFMIIICFELEQVIMNWDTLRGLNYLELLAVFEIRNFNLVF
ncbi:hypothetical protein H8356DRAFT_1427945 [Neocallimastix lanati (nom. inval.)]|nr:hypothetical protein H8356DRAFT_1427945 [Neocallimastix sp. JGI-2020a]